MSAGRCRRPPTCRPELTSRSSRLFACLPPAAPALAPVTGSPASRALPAGPAQPDVAQEAAGELGKGRPYEKAEFDKLLKSYSVRHSHPF